MSALLTALALALVASSLGLYYYARRYINARYQCNYCGRYAMTHHHWERIDCEDQRFCDRCWGEMPSTPDNRGGSR